jgi:hypothetical protein
MIAFLTAAALSLTYNCEVQGPRALNIDGEKVTLNELGVPPELAKWRFTVDIRDGKPPMAEVKWPGNPIQAEGRFAVISTGKNVYAFAALSAGPCLLTETMCASLFSIADQPDGAAKVLIQPTALWTDSKKDTRRPFVAMLQGQCSRSGTSG